jgi:hypothetical protein
MSGENLLLNHSLADSYIMVETRRSVRRQLVQKAPVVILPIAICSCGNYFTPKDPALPGNLTQILSESIFYMTSSLPINPTS